MFFVGDSFVAGVGDPQHRGWVGRLTERAHRIGAPITAYNLGVRRDTSDDILRRWADEVAVRRAAGAQERLVVSFGVNDTTDDGRATRVAPAYSVANLHTLLADAAAAGLPVVGDDPAVQGVPMAPPDWAVRLVRAGRGLLFLDELSTAPPAVQAALLRLVLERRVGALTLPPGVRIVAAANPRASAADAAARWRSVSTPPTRTVCSSTSPHRPARATRSAR